MDKRQGFSSRRVRMVVAPGTLVLLSVTLVQLLINRLALVVPADAISSLSERIPISLN